MNISKFRTIFNTEKVYPSQSKVTIYKERLYVPIKDDTHTGVKGSGTSSDEQLKLSLQRSKTTIKDIILCNSFDLFATFTFKNDRDNVAKCKDRMTNWLKSQQKYHGQFDYIVIPEFHKDGKSLHFHALFKGYTGELRPKISKRTGQQLRIKGHAVYRFKSWNVGISDASYIDDIHKTSSYITKYVTKDMPQFNGKKRYFVSQGLIRPLKHHNIDPTAYYDDPETLVFDYEDRKIMKRQITP